MAQSQNGGDNPDTNTITSLCFWVSLVATCFFMLEKWTEISGPINRYLIRKLPEYSDLAVLIAPWLFGLILLFALQLVMASVLKRLYMMVMGA